MKRVAMVLGGLLSLMGFSIMFTPIRTYFLIGWITGCVLLCHGLSTLGDGLGKRNRNLRKILVGAVTILVGGGLMATDLQQTLPQLIIVYIVAGGILVSGLIECIIGYLMLKKGQKSLPTLIFGGISCAVGLAGLIFKDATVMVIGFVVGYHILRMGLNLFFFGKNYDKPQVINL